jgi:hypothetical protein
MQELRYNITVHVIPQDIQGVTVDVVVSEIKSNLESTSWTRRCDVKPMAPPRRGH